MVYLSKNDEIIVDGIEIAIKGKKYILEIISENYIKAHRLSELTTLGETFDFVCKHYPDYEHCDEASDLDDLDCIINNECDDEKIERITYKWGSDPEWWEIQRDHIYSELIKGAVKNFKINNNIK